MSHPLRKSISLENPLIIGIASGRASLQAAGRPGEAAACDLIEFRIDALEDLLDEAAAAIQEGPLPALITVRDPAEGGMGDLSHSRREELFQRFLPFSSAIDVELRNLSGFSALVEQAQNEGVMVVGSFHDFNRFPVDEVAALLQSPPDLDALKIAVTPATEKELDSLFRLFAGRDHSIPAAVMGMGPLGPESRRRALREGSVLNYGYLVEPNAPGQCSARELRAHLDDLAGG